MGFRFNPPPGWPPPPPGFVPPPGWQPDPSWPPPPPGWQLWVPEDTDRQTQGMPGPSPYASPYPGQLPGAYPGQAAGPYPGGSPGSYPSGFPGAAGTPQAQGASGFSIASFICGLLGFTLIGIVLSVVFGIIALVRIHDRPQRGKGLAIAGLVLSGLWVLLFAGLIALGVSVKQPNSSGGGISNRGTSGVTSGVSSGVTNRASLSVAAGHQQRVLLAEAGLAVLADETVTMQEPEGPATFQWVIAAKPGH